MSFGPEPTEAQNSPNLLPKPKVAGSTPVVRFAGKIRERCNANSPVRDRDGATKKEV